MTRHYYQLLRRRAFPAGKRVLLREAFLPLLLGLAIGYVVGIVFSFEEIDSIDHITRVEHNLPESTLFFLRCLILVHPEAKKPLNFIAAIRDTYGDVCNQTIFYTHIDEIRKKASDQFVVVTGSSSDAFHWNYFQEVIRNSSEVPAQWTYVGDEQGFLSVQNLRKLVRSFNHRNPLLFGRIYQQTSFLAHIFPFLQRERMSIQAGVVMTNSVIKKFSKCNGVLLPRATETALIACATAHGVRAVDPVDQDGMHLFHEKDLKTLIPEAYMPKHLHGGKLSADCCSDHAISFGQMSYKDIRLGDFASVKWKVFGRGGVEEVNATFAIDPSEFEQKPPSNSTISGTVTKVAKQPLKKPQKKSIIEKIDQNQTSPAENRRNTSTKSPPTAN